MKTVLGPLTRSASIEPAHADVLRKLAGNTWREVSIQPPPWPHSDPPGFVSAMCVRILGERNYELFPREETPFDFCDVTVIGARECAGGAGYSDWQPLWRQGANEPPLLDLGPLSMPPREVQILSIESKVLWHEDTGPNVAARRDVGTIYADAGVLFRSKSSNCELFVAESQDFGVIVLAVDRHSIRQREHGLKNLYSHDGGGLSYRLLE